METNQYHIDAKARAVTLITTIDHRQKFGLLIRKFSKRAYPFVGLFEKNISKYSVKVLWNEQLLKIENFLCIMEDVVNEL